MAQCDSIVVGVVPSREGTLLVLPSPVVSAVTNFDSVHMPVVDDKLDGILRNRVDNDANRVLSSFDDATDYSGNTCFWMDQVSETTNMATRVNRKKFWVHDLPLEHASLLANHPSRWKRKEGRVMNMAGPSPIYSLAESFGVSHHGPRQVILLDGVDKCDSDMTACKMVHPLQAGVERCVCVCDDDVRCFPLMGNG